MRWGGNIKGLFFSGNVKIARASLPCLRARANGLEFSRQQAAPQRSLLQRESQTVGRGAAQMARSALVAPSVSSESQFRMFSYRKLAACGPGHSGQTAHAVPSACARRPSGSANFMRARVQGEHEHKY